MSRAVQAVMRAIGELVEAGAQATPSAVARHLDVSEGTARRYMATAQACGFSEKAGGGGRHPHHFKLTESGRANLVKEPRARPPGYLGDANGAGCEPDTV